MRRAPVVIAATAAGLGRAAGLPPQRPARARSRGAGPGHHRRRPRAGPPARPGQLTGSDTPNQYGDVQVRVTAAGGRITQVAARLPSGDGRSQQISSFAGPQLAQQALTAQSAKIDGVSGATYTSDSYKTSLQSAIDQLPSNGQAASG